MMRRALGAVLSLERKGFEMYELTEIERRHGLLWRFETARYVVGFWAEDEEFDPGDSFERAEDIAFASDGEPAHWFAAFVGVFDAGSGECLGWDHLGGCSYNSFYEFYSEHRWQYSRRQRRWITDPTSRAWKTCERLRPRRADGSRADGQYFPAMGSRSGARGAQRGGVALGRRAQGVRFKPMAGAHGRAGF